MINALVLLLLLGLIIDSLFKKIKVPSLVGFLIAGIICGPYSLNLISNDLLSVSNDIRYFALVIILLRAGMAIKKESLLMFLGPVLRLSIIPPFVEALSISALSFYLLGLSPYSSILLGVILSAVSPAVVVPLMLEFLGEGKGVRHGVPSLVLSSVGLNSVVVVALFGVLLNIQDFSTVGLLDHILVIPESIFFGVVLGVIIGYTIYFLALYDFVNSIRLTFVLVSFSVSLIWISDSLKEYFSISSLLSIIIIGYIIREKNIKHLKSLNNNLSGIWIAGEIFLFMLVGAKVNVDVIFNASVLGGIIILIGLVIRSFVSYLSLTHQALNKDEKMFCVVSYLPKATVQAAIGSIPLELGIDGGEVILAVCVLSILMTAASGAIGIRVSGKYWLR